VNKERVKKLKVGLYVVKWKSGGSSVASIGVCENGDKWIAPCNWVFPSSDQSVFKGIKSLLIIEN